MASFFLGDLNDYIAPGAVCVVPETAASRDEKSKPTINLNDCLACSGCITSAETVLVSLQTSDVVRSKCHQSKTQNLAVSVAPTVYTAFACKFKVSMDESYDLIGRYMAKVLHVDVMMDVNLLHRVALEYQFRQFLLRTLGSEMDFEKQRQMTMTSECPGWICYVEKRHAELVPYLSTVRSPQQMAGAMLRSGLLLDGCEDWFHFAVMPCYDKKLEASRSKHFGNDVDTVITTDELIGMMVEDAGGSDVLIYLRSLPVDWRGSLCSFMSIDGVLPTESHDEEQKRGVGECIRRFPAVDAAGGYLDYCLHRLTAQLEAIGGRCTVTSQLVRSQDLEEIDLVCEMGSRELRFVFVRVYGFRNIQTMLQRLKRNGRRAYDFVEVMACPGACLLGGGQPKMAAADQGNILGQREKRQRHRKELEEMHVMQVETALDEGHQRLLDRLIGWIDGGSDRAERCIWTSFESVVSSTSTGHLSVQW